MKVLTSDQMRQADLSTIADGVPGTALMENAAHRVAETLQQELGPLEPQNVVILCGKGNNGGDGLALARILKDRGVGQVRVVLSAMPEEYSGDAAINLKRLGEVGIYPSLEIPQKLRDRRQVTVVVDAILGTGLKGPATGRALELIQASRQFPLAKIVAIDLPSGLGGGNEYVRADITVTFTAPKVEHYLSAGAGEAVGRLIVTNIGTPPQLIPGGLEVSEIADFVPLFRPRLAESHKGDYGHVLVVGGAQGKSGAAALTGMAALRMGAGWVTVACSDPSRLPPELMTEPLGGFSLERKSVIAVGPGLGLNRELVSWLLKDAVVPVVIDADGLNSIAGTDFRGRGAQTVLTPHPGEMERLMGTPLTNRLEAARLMAKDRNVCLVLKGHRTLIALPDGNVWINISGSPALAKAGSGDILTGLIAGLIAQYPDDPATAVRAAVWLHGRCGELGAEELTERCVIATDLLRFLPRAIFQIAETRV